MNESKPRAKMKVLVVDDQQGIRRIVRQMLSHMGFGIIEEAHDGDLAWEMLQQKEYDLLIVDFNSLF